MTRKKQKELKIVIVLPEADQVFKLGAWPVETRPIILQAKVFQDGVDISRRLKINWKLKLSWKATYGTYQTLRELAGNPAEIRFETGGTLRIRASVVIGEKEYSARTRVNIIGTNPEKKQLEKALDSDLLKAQTFLESTWKQFDGSGQPLVNPDSSMRGLLQISEHWWGEKSPLTLKDFSRIAWQWDYNIKTAKLILDHYHQQVKIRFPGEKDNKQWDRTLKTYKSGPSSF